MNCGNASAISMRFDMSLNESFAKNIIGRTVKFDIQPSARGTGIIKNAVERPIRIKEFCENRGNIIVDYLVYDIEVEVAQGSQTGALYGGATVMDSVKSTSGTTTTITGITYGAINSGEIVVARC